MRVVWCALAAAVVSAAPVGGVAARCSVLEYGAVGDNTTDDTAALQRAIDGCVAKGAGAGAVVVLPEGHTFRVYASIVLRSHLTLYLERNASLFSAQTPSHKSGASPECFTSYWKNKTAVLCGKNLTDVAILGADPLHSIIDGGGYPWYASKATWGTGPGLFAVAWTVGVRLANVTFQNSAGWTLHPQYSRDILAEDIRVLAPRFAGNTDGFDPDSCENVVLRRAFIDVGDDGIALKSSNGTDGAFAPLRNVTIRDTTVLSRNVAVGSQTFGGIYDLLVENVRIGDDHGSSPWAIKYKSHRYYPGTMKNHTWRNIRIGKIAPNTWQQAKGGTAIIIDLSYGEKPDPNPPPCPTRCPLFSDVLFDNITVTGAVRAGAITGTDRNPLRSLAVRNLSFLTPPDHGWSCKDVAVLEATNVTPALSCTKPPSEGA
eukprot:Hpha_TRINITY_DN34539_c0_g1::TRINITY_DN34539_c0_g1_i1::g.96428::m.96428